MNTPDRERAGFVSPRRVPPNWVGLLAALALSLGPLLAMSAAPTLRTREWPRIGERLFQICLAVDVLLLLGWALRGGRKWGDRLAPDPVSSATRLAVLFPGPPESRLSRTAATYGLGVLLLVGAVLRAQHLNNDLWLDEIGSLISYMRFPFGYIVTHYLSPNQHLFYSLMGHASLAAFGESAAAVRLPAALFGVAGIWAGYRLARLTESRTDALLVAALLAVSYHHIFFSQNARGYTLFLFLALTSIVLFIRALTTDRTSLWAAYVVVTVLNMYNHLNAVFIFLGQMATFGLILVVRRRERSEYGPMGRRVFWIALLIGYLTLHLYASVMPAMVTFYATADRTGVGWSLLSADFFQEMAKGLKLGFASGLGALGVLVIGAFGAVDYWRRHVWMGVLFVLPSLFGVLTVWLMRVGTYPRFFLFALPVAFLMLIRGARTIGDSLAVRIPARAVATAWVGFIVAGAIGVSAFSLIPYYRLPKQDFTGALAFIHEAGHGAAPVLAADLAAVCATYYDPTVKGAQAAADIEPLLRQSRPVWLIYIFPASMKVRRPDLYQYIEDHFTVVRRFPGTVSDGTVYVCRSKETVRGTP